MPLPDDATAKYYPDWVHPRPSRRALPQMVTVQPLDPIPNPPPPTELTWHPTYPDWIWVKRGLRPGSQQTYTRWEGPPIADLRWRAQYPDRIVRGRMVPALQRPWHGPDFNFLQVPKVDQWRPTYPLILRRARAVPPTQTVYPIQGTTILTGASCVEWTDETTTRPMLTPETFTRSSMACQTQAAGFLLLEDGGFLLLEDGGRILLEDQTANACETFVRPMLTEEDWC